MAIAHVQSPDGANGGTAVGNRQVTVVGATSGNLLVLHVSNYQGVSGEHTVTDDRSNSWTKAVDGVEASHQYQAIWYCYANATGDVVITLTNTNGNKYTAIAASEYSGVNSAVSPLTNSNATAGSATSAVTAGSVTAAVDGSLYVWSYGNEDVSTTVTPDAGWTQRYQYNGDVNTIMTTWDQIQATAAALNPGMTLGANKRWAAAVAVFRPTGGGFSAARGRVNAGVGAAGGGGFALSNAGQGVV